MASRTPGLLGMRPAAQIDSGTLCRNTSPIPGLAGRDARVRTPSSPLIVFIGGAWDADSLLGKLFISWDKEGHNNLKHVYSRYANANHRKCFFTWDARKDAVKRILDEATTDPEIPVCLVGHSFGGDTAVDIAEDVNAQGDGFGIELVVTLDSVSPGAHVEWQKTKPPNVYYWFNVFVKWELEWNNLIAQAGGHWGSQEQADSNIQMPDGTYHHHANRMFDAVVGAVENFHLLRVP